MSEKMIKIQMPDVQWAKIMNAQSLIESKVAEVANSNEFARSEGGSIYLTASEIQSILDAFN